MALLGAFSIFDLKVGAFSPPFFVRTRGEAVRSFTDACKDDNLMFKRHPADYRLFFVGEFDDQAGRLAPISQPEPIIGGDEVG